MTDLWNYSTGFTGKWIEIQWTHEESKGTYSALQMRWTDSPSSHPRMVLTAKASHVTDANACMEAYVMLLTVQARQLLEVAANYSSLYKM
jgi:hypothetical protein